MSAPLVVNTTDGTCWTRREGSRGGEALYAPEKCGQCPQFVMATYAELDEYGITGSADVLPVPVDPGPVVRPLAVHEAQIDALAASGNRAVNDAVHEDLCACDAWPESCVSSGGFFQGYWDMGGLETAIPAVLGLWERMRGGELEKLRAELAGSEQRSERRRIAWRMARTRAISTGGAADRYAARAQDAHEALQHMLFTVIAGQMALHEANRERQELRARVAELEAQRERRRLRLIALQNDALSMRGSLSPNGEDRKVPFPLGETLTPAVDWLIARVAELEAERPVDALTRTFAPTQALQEDEFHLRHTDRVGRDLPETGGRS